MKLKKKKKATSAVEKLHGTLFHGRPISVEFSTSELKKPEPGPPSATIYIKVILSFFVIFFHLSHFCLVKGLPRNLDEPGLQNFLHPYGEILSCKILREEMSGASTGKVET